MSLPRLYPSIPMPKTEIVEACLNGQLVIQPDAAKRHCRSERRRVCNEMILALLLQIDWNKFRPEQLFGGQILERTPAGLTIVFLIGLGILVGFLVISFFDNFSRPKFLFEHDLPREVKRRLTQTITNRSIRVWQIVFFLLAFTVFGFQVYWTYYADEANEQFQALAYKDLRSRRTTAASLRGWMLDRTGKLGAALAYYKVNNEGEIDRTFSLEREMAHLLGTERGTPGLERTLYSLNADPMPEAWEILTKYKKPEPEQKDVRITIDRDLQAYAAKLLEGKKGGIVVIDPQTGDVLAMYSNPSYSLRDAETLEGFLKLEADKDQKPLLNRATREFYIPGSTFKTFTLVSAFRAGRSDLTFPGRPASANPPCYTPSRGSKPICDAGGSCHACAENIPIREAYKVSSNQYFAQLANAFGRDRLAETARIFGITPTETPEEALSQGYFPDIWNASTRRIANSIAPARVDHRYRQGTDPVRFWPGRDGPGLRRTNDPISNGIDRGRTGKFTGPADETEDRGRHPAADVLASSDAPTGGGGARNNVDGDRGKRRHGLACKSKARRNRHCNGRQNGYGRKGRRAGV